MQYTRILRNDFGEHGVVKNEHRSLRLHIDVMLEMCE